MGRLKRRPALLIAMSPAELTSKWSRILRTTTPGLPADLLRLGIAYEPELPKALGVDGLGKGRSWIAY